MAEEKDGFIRDWEMEEDFYQSEEKKELSLEDFITEEDLLPGDLELHDNSDELLKKTAADVHRVMELAAEGKTIAQIAAFTGLEEQYVYNIQVCAQGFHEDDEVAVAYLVLG